MLELVVELVAMNVFHSVCDLCSRDLPDSLRGTD